MIKGPTRKASDLKKVSIMFPLDSAAANITFSIGGKDNQLTAVKIALDIYDKKEEVQELFRIIDAIEQIHIYPFNIKKEDINTLVQNMTLLMQLNCLLKEKDRIKRSLRTFFQNTIDQMPRHPIDPGFPGYEAYEQELLAINDMLILMNRVLYKTQQVVAGSSLTLQKPHDQPCDLRQINMSILPQDLDSFLFSIEDNDACKSTWESHFQTFDAPSLSNYFKAVINMIQISSYDTDRIEFLIYKLNRFANSLSLRSNSFIIQMMFDVIKGAGSPLPRRAQNIEPSEPIKKLNALKGQVDQLVFFGVSFRTDFSTFRQSLTFCLKSHPTLKEMVLTELKQYLNIKEATVAKESPMAEMKSSRIPLPTMRSSSLIAREEKDQAERRYLEGAASLPRRLAILTEGNELDAGVQYIDSSRNDEEKWIFKPKREVSIEQIRMLQDYINRCSLRLTEALPQDLIPALQSLQQDYQSAPILSRQHQKRIFLDAWIKTINQYPEKTYAECYRETQQTMHEGIQTMVSERIRCGFFSQHRFKFFIKALLQAEPDYDPVNPVRPIG